MTQVQEFRIGATAYTQDGRWFIYGKLSGLYGWVRVLRFKNPQWWRTHDV